MRRTGTVKLDRREAQLLGNLSVFDLASLLKRETLDALSHIRAGGNGAATAECLELDIGDDAVFVHANLELHDIAATVNSIGGQR